MWPVKINALKFLCKESNIFDRILNKAEVSSPIFMKVQISNSTELRPVGAVIKPRTDEKSDRHANANRRYT